MYAQQINDDETRDVLRRISMHPDITCILLLVLDGPRPERRTNLPRSTFWTRVHEARKWVRDVAWQEPANPTYAVETEEEALTVMNGKRRKNSVGWLVRFL